MPRKTIAQPEYRRQEEDVVEFALVFVSLAFQVQERVGMIVSNLRSLLHRTPSLLDWSCERKNAEKCEPRPPSLVTPARAFVQSHAQFKIRSLNFGAFFGAGLSYFFQRLFLATLAPCTLAARYSRPLVVTCNVLK